MTQPEAYLSISELAALINETLERGVGTVRFEGEISQLTRAQSGHLYASLKDSESTLPIVIWASTVRSLGFVPQEGQSVQCEGRPNVYNKSGRLQIIVSKMAPSGEGLLRKKFLELKSKLEAEGLFAAERKRPLPFFPKAVGIVTSRSGAVIRDIDVKLRARMPHIPKYLVSVAVQGPGAAEEIARGVRTLSESGLVDVIIVGRGGGSLEDLWAFNEEVVVRAIFASRVPVVSAVGHEVDFSLSDFVADVRAATPTAAAEMVVPKRDDLVFTLDEYMRRLFDYERWLGPQQQYLDELATRLHRCLSGILDERVARLSAAEAHLKLIEPRRYLAALSERLQSLSAKLDQSLAARVMNLRIVIERMAGAVRERSPAARVALESERVSAIKKRLDKGIGAKFANITVSVDNYAVRLEATSPRSVLKRGFAMVKSKGHFVRQASEVVPGDDLIVSLVDSSIEARVSAVKS